MRSASGRNSKQPVARTIGGTCGFTLKGLPFEERVLSRIGAACCTPNSV